MKGFEPTVVGESSFLTASNIVHVNLREQQIKLEEVNKKAQNSVLIDRIYGCIRACQNLFGTVGGACFGR